MRIVNPILMNDWDMKKFLMTVLSIQLMMWGTICLDLEGLQIPIIRSIVGLINLIFIPGIIILRVLKLHKLSDIETLLYAVGLSIAALMFTGLFINTVYPFVGISGPISTIPLIFTISAIILVLCILCYIIDKNYSAPSYIDMNIFSKTPILILLLIPFLAVFGTYFVNSYRDNIILVFMIIIISVIVILIGFGNYIPQKLYPLVIFIISLSLLLHNSLISKYIWGWDIQNEYYTSNLVIQNCFWDSTSYGAVNAMLSIVMLVPILSDILSMNPIWIFKIIYPLIFSLVPLGLYLIFKKQTNEKIAFLACFFFVSLSTYYSDMLGLARQEIAELFLILVILLIINKDIVRTKRSVLLIIFGMSLSVSHYGLSYIFMFALIIIWTLLHFAQNCKLHQLFNDSKQETTISLNYVLVFSVFVLMWYMNISGASSLRSAVLIAEHIRSSFITDFLNPEATQGLDVILRTTEHGLAGKISQIINYMNQLLIIVGILVPKYEKVKFEKEYSAFSLVCLLILLANILVPYFASSLNISRFYQITLIFLAVYGVIGGIKIINAFGIIVGIPSVNITAKHTYKILSLYFVLFFLYQVGFVYGLTEGNYNSISLNSTKDFPLFNEQEISGAKWLVNVKNDNPIFADTYRWLLIAGLNGNKAQPITVENYKTLDNVYVYFGNWNVLNNEMKIHHQNDVTNIEILESEEIVEDKNKIYTNGGAQLYCL